MLPKRAKYGLSDKRPYFEGLNCASNKPKRSGYIKKFDSERIKAKLKRFSLLTSLIAKQ